MSPTLFNPKPGPVMKTVPQLLNGNPLPSRIYGTAIRANKDPPSPAKALRAGYRAIDTAATRKVHNEAIEGEEIESICRDPNLSLQRRDIFIQTKFTPAWAQAEPWPYDLNDDIRTQVFKSAMRSLEELKIDVFDAFMIHYPMPDYRDTLEAWRAMEEIHRKGGARYLGICHVSLQILERLYEDAVVKPSIVQNRCANTNHYDRDVLRFCVQNNIVYEAFGVVKRNNNDLLLPLITETAHKHAIAERQVFCNYLTAWCAQNGGILCILDGSSDEAHMEENVQSSAQASELNSQELSLFDSWLGSVS